MEHIRRIAALFIALSLLLPQRSCVNGGEVEIHYPLSSTDSVLGIAVVLALYLLPALVLLRSRFRIASLVAGIGAAGAGLYFVSYGATLAATTTTTLLVGWYVYTIGAVVYLGSSLVRLMQLAGKGGALPGHGPDGPPP